ncbi:unnamed protein product [Cyprideis torosa]|uniref:Uncharacterized protein n=1 Tax=Cyprideis torosa TaxID=163714 RepID=A0A7R8W4H0_9CRUS|nr:unnamed protein product [Cyprideis torosa]CAG0884204.1 unnamed protein product [Cyprideis torosa]
MQDRKANPFLVISVSVLWCCMTTKGNSTASPKELPKFEGEVSKRESGQDLSQVDGLQVMLKKHTFLETVDLSYFLRKANQSTCKMTWPVQNATRDLSESGPTLTGRKVMLRSHGLPLSDSEPGNMKEPDYDEISFTDDTIKRPYPRTSRYRVLQYGNGEWEVKSHVPLEDVMNVLSCLEQQKLKTVGSSLGMQNVAEMSDFPFSNVRRTPEKTVASSDSIYGSKFPELLRTDTFPGGGSGMLPPDSIYTTDLSKVKLRPNTKYDEMDFIPPNSFIDSIYADDFSDISKEHGSPYHKMTHKKPKPHSKPSFYYQHCKVYVDVWLEETLHAVLFVQHAIRVLPNAIHVLLNAIHVLLDAIHAESAPPIVSNAPHAVY